LVSSVKSRRNHYATLGLRPGATDAEIAAAFAIESRKIIQNPRVNEPDVREKARQVRAAHQTLRDPIKRAAYDSSQGFGGTGPLDSPDDSAKQSHRPFVAATPGNADEHVTEASSGVDGDSVPTSQPAPQPAPERQSAPAIALPAGLFVAGMAAKLQGKPQVTDAQSAEIEPDASLGSEQPNEATAAAAETSAGNAPEPEPEPQPETMAGSAASAERVHYFEDRGADTTAPYGDRRERKLNRAAAGGVTALAAALAAGAFWMWPSENNGTPPSSAPAGSQVAAADGTQLPPDMLNGVAPEPGAADDPYSIPEMADAGTYQSVTFADSGPVPATGSQPFAADGPAAAPVVSGPVTAAPPAAVSQGTAAETATTAAPSATGTLPTAVPAAGAAVAANVPARIQPAPDLRPVSPPKLVRGSILNSDNRRGAFQGTVSVQFTVGANGRATGCSPTASSGDTRLDAYTCQLVQQRLQFTPAVTAQGKAVASDMRATYTWGRKRRTLTGRLLDIVR
jgi:protein TonB